MPFNVSALRWIALVILLFAGKPAPGSAETIAGLKISNTAALGYSDAAGRSYTAQSNTIVETVASVAAITITPFVATAVAATDGADQDQPITRTFTIINAGNFADAYTIVAASAAPAIVSGIVFSSANGPIPVTPNFTVSPTIAPGGTIGVVVTLTTVGIAVGSTFAITIAARTTAIAPANGRQSATGKQWVIVQAGPLIGGPAGPASSIVDLVNQQPSQTTLPGATVSYSVVLRNYGGSAANAALLSDDVPAGIVPVISSITVNGKSASAQTTLRGQVLTIDLGSLLPGVLTTVTFTATVSASVPLGSSLVNVAKVIADRLAAIYTLPSSLFIGTSNIIYNANAGATAPVADATVTLFDAVTNRPIALAIRLSAARTTAAPAAASNPMITGPTGAYGFALTPGLSGSNSAPATYIIAVAAHGYVNRRVAVSIRPDAFGPLETSTMSALDGLPIAVAGGFAVSSHPAILSEVAGLLGNIAMFKTSPVSVAMTVDRSVASAGDRLVYTITFAPNGTDALGATQVTNTLPPGVVYARRTAFVDGVALEPTQTGRVLLWPLASVIAQRTIAFDAVVVPGVQENSQLENLVTVEALSAAKLRVGASATADTQIVGGALSDRIVITGRVFVDVGNRGHFTAGDRGVANVRIFLENGESVTTDSFGRYTFSAVRPGQHVLRLDTTTLPPAVQAFDERRYDSPRSVMRLVHGLMDSGLMQDVNFALAVK